MGSLTIERWAETTAWRMTMDAWDLVSSDNPDANQAFEFIFRMAPPYLFNEHRGDPGPFLKALRDYRDYFAFGAEQDMRHALTLFPELTSDVELRECMADCGLLRDDHTWTAFGTHVALAAKKGRA